MTKDQYLGFQRGPRPEQSNQARLQASLIRPKHCAIRPQLPAGLGFRRDSDQVTRHPGRTSSPLRPCLSFRYTQQDHPIPVRQPIGFFLRQEQRVCCRCRPFDWQLLFRLESTGIPGLGSIDKHQHSRRQECSDESAKLLINLGGLECRRFQILSLVTYWIRWNGSRKPCSA
jgi:hypothetical protein